MQYLEKVKNPIISFIYNIGHKFDFTKSVSHSSDKLCIKINTFLHFLTNNDDTSNVDEATGILDVVMAYHGRASEIFYGFRRHGEGFTIEGFADFGVEMNEDYVKDHLPGYEVRTFAFNHNAFCLYDELCLKCIYTKHGNAWEEDFVNLVIEWHHPDDKVNI